MLHQCETAIRAAGFQRVEIIATLAGVPLYVAGGYLVVEHWEIPLNPTTALPVVRLTKGW